MKRHAVITGLGIVSPIGIGVEKFWSAALAGRSGIRVATSFDTSKLPPDCRVVGEVVDFNPRDWMPGFTYKMAARFSQFAVAAAKMACDDSRLDAAETPADRLKVSIGTTMNGQIDLGEATFSTFLTGGGVLPWTCLEYPAHAATSHVAIANGARGQTVSFATACAAGLDAIGWAADEVRRGHAAAVIAGGTETPLSQYSMALFRSVGVLSSWHGSPSEASRPFDRLRSGLVLAEGAAVVVVEDEEQARARRAPIYARVLGFASTTEGTHLRKVDETGEAGARAMSAALASANLSPRDIDYIAAHGNSMQDYDAAETASIKRVFGLHAWNVPVSSLKSMCGQALSASSAMQVVTSCLILRDGIVPPTINYEVPDSLCDLDYVPHVARRTRVRRLLIHAHSLGGSHVAMVLGTSD